MNNLIAIAFENRDSAFDLRRTLIQQHQEGQLRISYLSVVTRDEEGAVNIHEPVELAALGALSGSFWGALAGVLFRRPLAGGVVGAGLGAIAGSFVDNAVNGDFKRHCEESLEAGTSAVVVMVDEENLEPLLAALAGVGGKLVRTSLDGEDCERLQQALLAEQDGSCNREGGHVEEASRVPQQALSAGQVVPAVTTPDETPAPEQGVPVASEQLGSPAPEQAVPAEQEQAETLAPVQPRAEAQAAKNVA